MAPASKMTAVCPKDTLEFNFFLALCSVLVSKKEASSSSIGSCTASNDS